MRHLWKKRAAVFAAAVCLIAALCAGCGKQKADEYFTSKGRDLEVTVLSNPTTGYVWEFELSNAGALSFVSREYTGPQVKEGEEPALGASGHESFRFEGVESGAAAVCDITFTYGRSWEVDGATSSFTLRVSLDDKGKITEVTRKGGDYPFGESGE